MTLPPVAATADRELIERGQIERMSSSNGALIGELTDRLSALLEEVRVRRIGDHDVLADEVMRLKGEPARRFRVSFDQRAGVLYTNFDPPIAADDAHEQDEVLFRLKDGHLIGVTILNVESYARAALSSDADAQERRE